jgi:pimeloyl-ACP methyl ester carboxylesterase
VAAAARTGAVPTRWAGSTADLDAVRAATGHERVTLLGHSFGATLALHYATHPDRVRTLLPSPAATAVPTVIVHGALDLRPPSVTDSRAAALPDVTRVITRSAAHYPWIEAPQAFRDAIRTGSADW